jgi:hypothetical protein
MLVYNKTYFDNFYLLRKAKEWIKSGYINDSEYETILKQHPSPYKSFNIFARIALFIFTLFILGSATGLINIIFSVAEFYRFITFQCFFFGIGAYILAEISIRKLSFFRSGIKEALLYTAIVSLSFGVVGLITGGTFNFYGDPLIYFLIILPIISFAAIRFCDRFLSLCVFIFLIIIDALLVLKMGAFGKLILPFESMAFSFLLYYIAGQLKKKQELHYWKGCINLIQIASLITLYLSGNYMVVRKLTEALLDTEINPGEDISLAIFFYTYTIIVPLLYVWLGLKRKDYTFFRAGMLLEIAGILAIKYYHSIMPPETAMMLGGIVVILIAYFSIKYLKTPKHGITFEIYKRSSREEALANIASIVASKLVADQPTVPQQDGGVGSGGGGQFGGGGAGADY